MTARKETRHSVSAQPHGRVSTFSLFLGNHLMFRFFIGFAIPHVEFEHAPRGTFRESSSPRRRRTRAPPLGTILGLRTCSEVPTEVAQVIRTRPHAVYRSFVLLATTTTPPPVVLMRPGHVTACYAHASCHLPLSILFLFYLMFVEFVRCII